MNPLHSIKGKLLVFSLIISVIPITTITTIYYFKAGNAFKRQILGALTAVAEARKAHVLELMEAEKVRTIDFSSDGFIRESLQTINDGGNLKDQAVIDLNRHLSENKMPLDTYITSIQVTDKDGRVVSSTNEAVIGHNIFDRDIFKNAADEVYAGLYVSHAHSSDPRSKKQHIDISAPITAGDDRELLGLIINEYDLVLLSKIATNRTGLGETGEVYLVNRDGLMLTESRFMEDSSLKQVVDTEPVRRIAGDGKGMAGVYPDYRGVPVVGASVYLPGYGWTLLAEIDKAEALVPLEMLRETALTVVVIGAGAAAAIGIIFAIFIARPINKLKDITERFAAGDLSVRAEIERDDEIGLLAGSFNTMAEALSGKISEHEKAEEKLRQFYRAVEQSPCTVVITDTAGTIQHVNPKFTQLTGYTPEEALGKNPRLWKSGKTPPEVYEQLWNTITSGRVWHGELCNRKKSGELYWESTSISPIRDSEDNTTHFVAVREDITERRRMEEALRENENKFRSMSELAQDAIIMLDSKEKVSYWNKAAESIFGYPKKDAMGKNLYTLIIPHRFREDHLKGFERFQDTGQGAVMEKTVELAALRKDGTEFPIELSLSGVQIKGKWNAIGIVRDITERRQTEETIRQMAYHDALTGLPNRKLFVDRLTLELAHAHRDKQALAVLFLDLDRFKDVNDKLGHAAGDKLLREVAVRLMNCVRESDTVARMGGDEFTLLLPGIKCAADTSLIAGKILESVKQPLRLDGREVNITTSVGIALYPDGGKDPDTLLKNADAAMYHAKETGRNNYQVYTPS